MIKIIDNTKKTYYTIIKLKKITKKDVEKNKIRIIDQFDVEKGGYYETEEELVDKLDMSIADIKRDYAGIRCDMFREIEEEYNITEKLYTA